MANVEAPIEMLRPVPPESAASRTPIVVRVLALASLLSTVVLGLAPVAARATTYYVSPSGRDANSGRSPTRPWRTVTRVNRAPLAARDRVLFEGGSRFADATLMPRRSGASGGRIWFGSYGTGRANLARGVWLYARSHFLFTNLRIEPASSSRIAFASGRRGAGVRDVVIRDLTISGARIGIHSANPLDARWRIVANTVTETGDSGILLRGRGMTVVRNTIVRTGLDGAIRYPTHGVYVKGAAPRIARNRIDQFRSNGISLRRRDARVVANRISNGAIGVAYFQGGRRGGLTEILYNRVVSVGLAGVYLDPSTIESFVIANNSVVTTGGAGMNVKRVVNLTLANNLATGQFRFALQARRPRGAYRERNDLWFDRGGRTVFNWNLHTRSFPGYRRASGQGRRDLVVDPLVGLDLILLAASPALDAGTTAVSPLSYAPRCDGLPLNYCGPAPDMGAVERPRG